MQSVERSAYALSGEVVTGVKEGKASESAQEALAAPELLEASKPATDADLPGHRQQKPL